MSREIKEKATLTPFNVDPSRCPLCGEANACVMESATPGASCWCQSAEFGKELLASVPEAAQRKACICERCAKVSG